MSKSRRTEKQVLDREVERSIQEEQDIQAAIRDSGYFYDEDWYTYQEYLAKQEKTGHDKKSWHCQIGQP